MRRVKPLAFPLDPLVLDPSAIASFIRAARTQSGLTLEEAALTTGVAKSTMQAVETQPHKVAFATVLHVAKELGVAILAVPAEQREVVRRMAQHIQDAEPGSTYRSA